MNEVYVIGGACFDIVGKSDAEVVAFDSNIGTVMQSFGGVGRNIAENIARYQLPVHFVSVLGDDSIGKSLYAYCESLGMDMNDCMVVSNERTACYLAFLDEKGEMQVGINDMKLFRYMDQSYLKKILDKMDESDLLVLDTNFDEDRIAYILDHACCPVYVDPISCKKGMKLVGHLDKVFALKPNVFEASVLSNIEYDGLDSVEKMGRYFLDCGVDEVYITLGEDGVMAFSKDECVYCKCECASFVNATGAGDAFMGAMVVSSRYFDSLLERVKFAQSASVCTLESYESVCPQLSFDFVMKKKDELDFIVGKR